MNIDEKLHSQELYFPDDEEMMRAQAQCLEKLYDYNMTRPSEADKRTALLKEMFAEIGDNSVIGAGSVVSKDIPPNCVAVGNPCRVLREISEHDKEYYYKDKKINWSDFEDYV